MKKAKLVKVTLELRQGSDGHWLSFKNGKTEAVINIENHFPKYNGIINNTIRNWAKAQFKE